MAATTTTPTRESFAASGAAYGANRDPSREAPSTSRYPSKQSGTDPTSPSTPTGRRSASSHDSGAASSPARTGLDGTASGRTPLHSPPVLLPARRDGTPSPRRSQFGYRSEEQRATSSPSRSSPDGRPTRTRNSSKRPETPPSASGPRTRPQAVYDPAFPTPQPSPNGTEGRRETHPDRSAKRLPVSHPLAQTSSTDSAESFSSTTSEPSSAASLSSSFTTGGARGGETLSRPPPTGASSCPSFSSSSASTAADENDDSWASEWIDPELDELARPLFAAEAEEEEPRQSERRGERRGGGGAYRQKGARADEEEAEEVVTDLTPMRSVSNSSLGRPQRSAEGSGGRGGGTTDGTTDSSAAYDVEGLPAIQPLFSSTSGSSRAASDPSGAAASDRRTEPPRRGKEEEEEVAQTLPKSESTALSDFDWVAAYEDEPEIQPELAQEQEREREQEPDQKPERESEVPTVATAADTGSAAAPSSTLEAASPALPEKETPSSSSADADLRLHLGGRTIPSADLAPITINSPARTPPGAPDLGHASGFDFSSSPPPEGPPLQRTAPVEVHEATAASPAEAAAAASLPMIATHDVPSTSDEPTDPRPQREDSRPALAPSTNRRSSGTAPVVPVKSSRRASLLTRRSGGYGVEQQLQLQQQQREEEGRRRSGPIAEGGQEGAVGEAAAAVSTEQGAAGAAADAATAGESSDIYDLAAIADAYARNSLYYPPPDATPRARSRGASTSLRPNSSATASGEGSSSGTVTARNSAADADGDGRADDETRGAGSSRNAPGQTRTETEEAPAVATSASPDPQAFRSLPPPSPADAAMETISPERTPPPPPPAFTKRPSEDASTFSQSSRKASSDAGSRSASNLSGSRRPSEVTLPSAVSTPLLSAETRDWPARTPLLRRRALPPAVIISNELKKATTTRERCRLYERKLNELARERSRLDEWILATSPGGHRALAAAGTGGPPSPSRSRRFRQQSSSSTFAPRGDGYRAKEILRGTFSPHDLVPSAPYPGVLNMTPSRSMSHNSLATASSGGGHGSSGGGKSFFSNFGRGSLGRRMSKREQGGAPAARSSGKSSGKASIRSTISGPVQVLSSTNSALAPVTDESAAATSPRPLASSAIGAGHRASFDSRVSSPSTSPTFSRNSFAYGSTSSRGPAYDAAGGPRASPASASAAIPTFQVTRGSVYYDNGEKGSQVGDLDEEKLDRLADILPQAPRAELAAALESAGGDDVLAISVYLSSEAAS